jgi:hypothetical protein
LPEVKAEFANYTLLKLYTDTVPGELYPIEDLKTLSIDRQEDDANKNSAFQKERFNDVRLPLYVVIEPTATDFRIVSQYAYPVIDNKDDFLRFLRENANLSH